jgi:hypothetical protein
MDVRPDKYETDRLVCTDMPWAEGLQKFFKADQPPKPLNQV